jgi:hypothetical protein
MCPAKKAGTARPHAASEVGSVCADRRPVAADVEGDEDVAQNDDADRAADR